MIDSVRKVRVQSGILFELEMVAVKGRKTVYDVWKKVLAAREAELTPALFMRYGLNASPKAFLPELLNALGKGRFSPDKILADYQEAVAAAFPSKNMILDAGLGKIMKFATAQKFALGAVSGLDPAAAAALMKALDIGDAGVKLVCAPSLDQEYPSADAWMKLAKQIGLPPVRCIAIVSSDVACRAALTTGMRCIVVPDDFTAFQDFGGAEAVVEKLEERTVRDVLALLRIKIS
jgi:beta-phosphoglucomutase-like phosphatase (HAD superfamily)